MTRGSFWGLEDRWGWHYAKRVFEPSGDFLHANDIAMDWLYKVRAGIGVALLVIVGRRYHESAKKVVAIFNPVLGGVGDVTGPLILGLLFVIPSTVAVVLYTKKKKKKRAKAFHQMIRFPVKTALICLGIYGFSRLLGQVLNPGVASGGSPGVDLIGTVGSLVLLRYGFFLLGGIYLVTAGYCRLGDGHPLLPPIVGSMIAWIIAFVGLFSSPAAPGEPSPVWLGALLGGPATVTLLGYVEIARLRTRFRAEFPFRDGPLPELDLDEFAAGEVTENWSAEDEGLLRAYKLYKYLKKGNEPTEIPAARCPVRLKRGEKCLVVTKARLFKWEPEKHRYIVAGDGPLVLTDLALIQSANGRMLRFRRVYITVEETDAPEEIAEKHARVGIGFYQRRPDHEEYWIDVLAVDRRYLAFLLEHTYAGFDYEGKFKMPDGFKKRARELGKL